MGDNNVATVTGNGAIFHNPAGLAGATLYSVELGYDASFRTRTHRIGFSVADSKTNDIVAGGVAYTFSFAPDGDAPWEQRKRDHDVRVSAAVPLVAGRLSLGVTGTYLAYTHGDGETKHRSKGFSLDAGLMARLTDSVFFGFSAQDLVYVDGGTGRRNLRSGLGAFFGPIQLNVEWGVGIDPGQDEVAQHRFGVGTELNLEGFMLRLGYRRLFSYDDNVLSVGAGFRSGSFGFDTVYRQYFNERKEREFGLSLVILL